MRSGDAILMLAYVCVTGMVIGSLALYDGAPLVRTNWDDAVRRYTNIKVTYTLSPNADDRWRISVKATGTFKSITDFDIESWDLGAKRHQLDAEMKARNFVEKLRTQVAAAQSRKMRSRTQTVPL